MLAAGVKFTDGTRGPRWQLGRRPCGAGLGAALKPRLAGLPPHGPPSLTQSAAEVAHRRKSYSSRQQRIIVSKRSESRRTGATADSSRKQLHMHIDQESPLLQHQAWRDWRNRFQQAPRLPPENAPPAPLHRPDRRALHRPARGPRAPLEATTRAAPRYRRLYSAHAGQISARDAELRSGNH